MRATFSSVLVDLTINNDRVYLLTGDHGYELFDELRKKNPERYLNAGIAEQNMVGVAAGLAKSGLIPIVYGLSAFLPVRVLEQIKLDICFEELRVIIIGDGAGVVYSKLGVSHQCLEDISALRAIPNIRIFSPADKYEMQLCLLEAVEHNGPTYIRVGKCDLGDVHNKYEDISKIGTNPVILGKPSLPVIFATGSMVRIAKELIENELNGFSLYSVSSIKPLDKDSVIRAATVSSIVITLEEHSIYGGLGSSIAEVLSEFSPRKVLRLGVEDRFSDKCGSYNYLLSEHGLDQESLKRKIEAHLK